MKKICLNLHIHQPFRLKRYRFFDIGNDHYYFDDFQNEEVFRQLVEESYLPTLKTIQNMVVFDKSNFKFSLAISGTALDQIELYAPEILDVIAELYGMGNIEFIASPYAYSLSSLGDIEEFRKEVEFHKKRIKMIFGADTKVLRNTELIYSDDIAAVVSKMGFKAVMTEGAKHILGWKSPNYIYKSAVNPNLKVMLRNSNISNDIVRNFSNPSWSEYPLTAEKFAVWIASLPEAEKVIYLDIPIEAFGHSHKRSSGIFDFLKALPKTLAEKQIEFDLPSNILDKAEVADVISVNSPISWSEEEKGITPWLGNVLQQEAFNKMAKWGERARLGKDRRLRQDWLRLQSCDHFFYMTTLYKDVRPFSPYDNPYDAFNNYMNVLSDLLLRVEAQYPSSIENEELNALLLTIKNQDKVIEELEKKVEKLEKSSKKSTKKSTKK